MNAQAPISDFESSVTRVLSVVSGYRLSKQQRQELVRSYGNQSSAYFTLQDGVDHFGIEGVGFISYYVQKIPFGVVNIVYANPICNPEKLQYLLSEFFAQTPGRKLFLSVDKATADELEKLGYRSNQMGTEFSMPIQKYEIKGKSKKHLRHSANLGIRHNIEVKELLWNQVDEKEVRRISDSWRHQKIVKNRELKLVTRPPEMSDGWMVRKFYCYQEGKLLGYVFFDPYFKDGKVIGYCANILRRDPKAGPSDLLDFVILEAMKKFRAEGIEQLSLGISPLYNVKAESGDRPLLRRVLQFMYNYCNSVYAFKALSYHKTRYRGTENTWYMCSDDIPIPALVWAVLCSTNLVGLKKEKRQTTLTPVAVN